MLLISRVYISGNITYAFLIWNLFLAWIPFLLSRVLVEKHSEFSKIKLVLIFSAWLLFFPNAPYIITDLIHLKQKSGIPLWFDLILIFSFIWNGLVLAFLSLLEVHQVILEYCSQSISWFTISLTLLLSGFGIYLGRFERWNSWDLAFHPLSFVENVMNSICNPELLPRIAGVTFGFGMLLFVAYFTFYQLANSRKNLE